MEPCGTPQGTVAEEDDKLFSLTVTDLSCKCDVLSTISTKSWTEDEVFQYFHSYFLVVGLQNFGIVISD